MSCLQLVRLGLRNVSRDNVSKLLTRNYMASQTLKAQKKDEDDTDPDKPYSYLNSKAYKWKASETRRPYENKPWFQSLVISASLATFMIYFFIFREENDIDKTFERDLRSYFTDMSDADYKKAMGFGVQQNLPPPKPLR